MKDGLLKKVDDLSQKLAGPMTKISKIPVIEAIQGGIIATTPIILVGSIFILLYTFASPSIGSSGAAILPFLEPYQEQLLVFHNLAINSLALYCAVAIAYCYARILKIDKLSSVILGLASFLLINIGEITEGSISIANFGATGLVTAIAVSLISIKVYELLVKHKVTIKLPDSVPHNVLNAFTSLIPYLLILTAAWVIRTLLSFDVTVFISQLIAPLIQGADNIVFFSFMSMMHGLFWSVGLHWDNMTGSVVTPLVTMWTQSNMNAYIAEGVLPYIYTSGLYRITIVPGIFYPPLILMLLSKQKQIKSLGIACAPAALFCITEPITFGFLAFNSFFIIPMALMGLLSGFISYLASIVHLLPPFHLELPWATPTFIYGLVGTGSVWGILIQVVIILLGLIVYYPFFKLYEKDQLKRS